MERHTVERRKPHRDMKSRSNRAYALRNLSQESCAVFKAAAITSFSRAGAEKLVPQVAVAMFYVHEVEAQLPSHECGVMKVFNDGLNFCVGEQRVVSR